MRNTIFWHSTYYFELVFVTNCTLVTARGMFVCLFVCLFFVWGTLKCPLQPAGSETSLCMSIVIHCESCKRKISRYFFLGSLFLYGRLPLYRSYSFRLKNPLKSHMVGSVMSKVSRGLSWWSSYGVDYETVITCETFAFHMCCCFLMFREAA